MAKRKYLLTKGDEGCWFDSHRGIYIGQAVLEMAKEYGYRGQTRKRYADGDAPIGASNGWETIRPDDEFYYEYVENAENYLDSLAPDGYWVGYNDGDFGMYRIEDEEEAARIFQSGGIG